ncbi:hypothetical protein U1Q18_051238, partial [Sarracenia purpurea var. burkii]
GTGRFITDPFLLGRMPRSGPPLRVFSVQGPTRKSVPPLNSAPPAPRSKGTTLRGPGLGS